MINIQKSSYLKLGNRFYSKATISPMQGATTILFNHELATELCLGSSSDNSAWQANNLPKHLEPIALVYAGHQYGRYTSQLGDGRAAILGEVTDNSGNVIDLQLKGSGPTEFSRGGDGYATISSVLREYIISEAMHALGVPTTRSLAAAVSTDSIIRATPEPRGLLTRAAASHIRIGSFEYFAANKDLQSLKQLADYTINRNFPSANNISNKYQALLGHVCSKQAILMAKWMGLGFIHGVMNTDNTAISGETLDYGPCAFMDEYKAQQVFSAIDKYSRYAYSAQPDVMLWNLTSFANCIAPLLAKDAATQEAIIIQALDNFLACFEQHYFTNMLAKIGLVDHSLQNKDLVTSLLIIMEDNNADFTLTFTHLATAALGSTAQLLSLFKNKAAIEDWITKWQYALEPEQRTVMQAKELMLQHNPIVIPRNHIIESAVQQYTATKDITDIKELLTVLQQPFAASSPAYKKYMLPPEDHEKVCQTFCGT
jgi:serine/tyrosine/threonine adenylyltransferase